MVASFLLLAIATLLAPATADSQVSRVLVRSLPGLHRVELILPEGRIAVNIPDDLAPGGLFTATVARLPGRNGTARLNALMVEVPALRPGPLPDRFEFLVDANTPRELRVEVREREGGALLGQAVVPVRTTAPPRSESIPTVGQVGSPARVRGEFDGNFANSAAVLSGTETVLLAESPRQLVFEVPDAAAGMGEVVVREQDRVTRGPFRVVSVLMTPAAAVLKAGERRTVDIGVSGLAGLTAPLAFRLSVTGPVTMDGGREQRLQILPASVGPDGRWTLVRNLVAVDSGEMSLSASVGTDAAAAVACSFAGEPVRVYTAIGGSGNLWNVGIETAIGEKRVLWLEGRRPALRPGMWITLRNCRQDENADGRATGWAAARDPRRSSP
ncbi:MAG: hypothetical protein ACRENB_04585 [Gemmatimonadales bacterium]